MRTSTSALDAIGTDRVMAENAKNRMANAGILEGVKMPLVSHRMGPIKSPLSSVELTVRIVIGSILAPPDLSTARALLDQDRRTLLSSLKQEDSDEGAGGVGSRNVIADLNEQAAARIVRVRPGNELLQIRQSISIRVHAGIRGIIRIEPMGRFPIIRHPIPIAIDKSIAGKDGPCPRSRNMGSNDRVARVNEGIVLIVTGVALARNKNGMRPRRQIA